MPAPDKLKAAQRSANEADEKPKSAGQYCAVVGSGNRDSGTITGNGSHLGGITMELQEFPDHHLALEAHSGGVGPNQTPTEDGRWAGRNGRCFPRLPGWRTHLR